MKNKRCLLLLTMIGLVLALSTLTFKAALASGPIEMKAVAFLPTTSIETKMFIEFIEDVQKKTGGVLKIKLLGGPEVIPAREQVDALQSGVVQIAMIPPSYYAKKVPAISANYLISTLEGKRKSGFYDLMAELTELKAEMRFLGEINSSMGMYMFTNFLIKNPHTDFKGKKMRTLETYDKFLEGLGAAGVVVPRMDIYPAMERGVINGFFAPTYHITAFGLVEVTKYLVHPQMWWGGVYVNLNLDTWKKLPKDIQKILQETMIEKEQKWEHVWAKLDREEIAKMKEKGVKEIKFSPEGEKWFLNLAITKEWEDIVKQDPVNADRVRKFVFGN